MRQVVDAAPPLAGWTITAFRPPKSLPYSLQMGAPRLSTEDLWFSLLPDGERAALRLYIRGLTAENASQVAQASFILRDCVLGEYDCETKIGVIRRQPLPADPERHRQPRLARLRELILAGARSASRRVCHQLFSEQRGG